jgi:hypothetical protein
MVVLLEVIGINHQKCKHAKVKQLEQGPSKIDGTRDISVFQIFSEEASKPIIMLALDDVGYFYNEIGGAACQNAIRAFVGTTYKISASFNATNGNAKVWVNDKFCAEISANSSAGKLYVKIGSYRTNSGTGTLTTKWSNFNIY